ncbi:MAG TPA: fumarylacetoacetate hydrolase family protein [Candidatus Binataceae bacterium]
MRLVTFEDEPRLHRLGAVAEGFVIDLNAACRALMEERGERRAGELAREAVPPEMVAFLEAGERAMNATREALALVARLGADDARERGLARRAESVRLRAPVPRPTKLILVGLNYRDHAEEAGFKIPDVPTFFSKYANCVIGPGDAVRIPKVSSMIDYEGEFAFIIGRAGRDIPPARAMEYVAGYTIMNDVSCRDYQMKTGQWMIGKTFDTFAPMGPYLVTRDEISDPHNLEISLYLNGQRMQHSNTRNLIFKTEHVVSYLSQVFTLEPGDVISTGTPAGVGYTRKPPVFMKPGDRVRVEVEGLGALENPVEAA